MRNILLIPLIIISTLATSQTIDKTYFGYDNSDSIKFIKNNGILFRITQFESLGGEVLSGKGTYRLTHHSLFIYNISHDKTQESFITVIKDSTINLGSYIKGTILNELGYPLGGVNIVCVTGIQSIGMLSNVQGRFSLNIPNPIISDIEFSHIGYISAFYFLKSGKYIECKIIMREGNIRFLDFLKLKAKIDLNNQTSQFKIRKLEITDN